MFAFAFLETSMLFPFLPSEIVVPAAAAGTVAGGLVAYAVGRRGYGAVESSAVRVSADELDRGRDWFRRWGEGSVLWRRFLPFLRSVVSLPAGFAGMGRAKFPVYSGIGGFGFNAAVAAVVVYGRRRSVYRTAFDWARGAVASASPAALAGAAALTLVACGVGGWAWGAGT